jgi:hypothetical protein
LIHQAGLELFRHHVADRRAQGIQREGLAHDQIDAFRLFAGAARHGSPPGNTRGCAPAIPAANGACSPCGNPGARRRAASDGAWSGRTAPCRSSTCGAAWGRHRPTLPVASAVRLHRRRRKKICCREVRKKIPPPTPTTFPPLSSDHFQNGPRSPSGRLEIPAHWLLT